jgi:hypothetical protein
VIHAGGLPVVGSPRPSVARSRDRATVRPSSTASTPSRIGLRRTETTTDPAFLRPAARRASTRCRPTRRGNRRRSRTALLTSNGSPSPVGPVGPGTPTARTPRPTTATARSPATTRVFPGRCLDDPAIEMDHHFDPSGVEWGPPQLGVATTREPPVGA